MSQTKVHRLGDLQLKIMKFLWERGDATVAEVHQAITRERGLAYTTVATMLRKMEGRRLVKHRVEGRSFVYRPAVAADAVTRSMAGGWPSSMSRCSESCPSRIRFMNSRDKQRRRGSALRK